NQGQAGEDAPVESSTIEEGRLGLLRCRNESLHAIDVVGVVAGIENQRGRACKNERFDFGALVETENISTGVFSGGAVNAISQRRGKVDLGVRGMGIVDLDRAVIGKPVAPGDE